MKRKGIQVALDVVFGNIQCQDKIFSKPVQPAPTTGQILFGNGAFQGVIEPFHPGRASVKPKGKTMKKGTNRRRRQPRRQKENEAPTSMDWEPGNIQCKDKISSKPVQSAPTMGQILFGNRAFQGVIKPFHPSRARVKPMSRTTFDVEPACVFVKETV
jgi:hypothetical protein